MNATRKQVDLALRLGVEVGHIRAFQRVEARLALEKLTSSEIHSVISAFNQKLGYDPNTTAATEKQRSYIVHLEKQVLGTVETTEGIKLTYSEADARIKRLKAQLPNPIATTTNVVDFFTRKAV